MTLRQLRDMPFVRERHQLVAHRDGVYFSIGRHAATGIEFRDESVYQELAKFVRAAVIADGTRPVRRGA